MPLITSPLNGRKTIIRNSTVPRQLWSTGEAELLPLTLALPVPCPMRPSEVFRMSYMHMQKPTFGTTLFAYFSLILSSISSRFFL